MVLPTVATRVTHSIEITGIKIRSRRVPAAIGDHLLAVIQWLTIPTDLHRCGFHDQLLYGKKNHVLAIVLCAGGDGEKRLLMPLTADRAQPAVPLEVISS